MKKKILEIVLIFLALLFGVGFWVFNNQSKQIVTLDNINYSLNSKVNYKVFLKENKYYPSEYLDEGMQYISSIIDYVNIDYLINAKYEGYEKYNVSKKVVANIEIVDADKNDNVIYKTSEVIKEENTKLNQININDNIKVDYKKYNALTNEFKTSYGISARCNLYIDYTLTYSSENGVITPKPITTRVTIPLSEQMIKIDKTKDSVENSVYIGKRTDTFINKVMRILSIVSLGLGVVCLLLFVYIFFKRIKSESKYDRFIKKTLRDNDSYITTAKEYNVGYNESIIKVDSFKELLDVRNNVEKPIVYVKVSDDESVFYIVDNEIYEYRVNRKEMDE